MMTIGLAPAGGCVVDVRRIAAIATPTDKATDNGLKLKKWKNSSPIKAVMRCPNMIFLGCASGLSGSAKSSTHVAPKGASRIFSPVSG